MFIKSKAQATTEHLQGKAITKHKENKLADALDLYLQSIEANDNQPEWVYGNSITLSAQIDRCDLGLKLQEKAIQLYPDSDEITRAIALLYEKQQQPEKAVQFYRRSLVLNPEQPEWLYVKLHNLLRQANLLIEAQEIRQQGWKYFPQSTLLASAVIEPEKTISNLTESEPATNYNLFSHTRSTPQDVENKVDLNISNLRRQMMDSAIVEQFEILLEQVLCNLDRGGKEVNPDALVRCLAEIKTDIHYLKTKLLDPPAAIVDPQARPSVDFEKLVNCGQLVPVKCDLRKRIVGSGWHTAEQHGRWMGSGTLSSLVLPYPSQGKYRLEIIIRAEAKSGLLNTLKVHLDRQPLEIIIRQNHQTFPAIVNAEVILNSAQNNSFLGIDLAIAETVSPQAKDSRLIGLLVESINLIPLEQ